MIYLLLGSFIVCCWLVAFALARAALGNRQLAENRADIQERAAARALRTQRNVTAELRCEHEWEYLPREPGEIYTGYCERCAKCGEIVQIPQ